MKICSAIKDRLCVVESNSILQSGCGAIHATELSNIFFAFRMTTCKHLIPASEEAHASAVQLPALCPASSN